MACPTSGIHARKMNPDAVQSASRNDPVASKPHAKRVYVAPEHLRNSTALVVMDNLCNKKASLTAFYRHMELIRMYRSSGKGCSAGLEYQSKKHQPQRKD
jgi:hypothetical protein